MATGIYAERYCVYEIVNFLNRTLYFFILWTDIQVHRYGRQHQQHRISIFNDRKFSPGICTTQPKKVEKIITVYRYSVILFIDCNGLPEN